MSAHDLTRVASRASGWQAVAMGNMPARVVVDEDTVHVMAQALRDRGSSR